MKKIYLIGGGGHCKSCIDVIEQTGKFEIQGILDVKEKIGQKIYHYEIVGDDDYIVNLKNEDVFFLITLGQIKSPEKRVKYFNMNLNWATVISPRAYVSPHAQVGPGTIIMHDALVNAGAKIGANCIINTKALIEHDSMIGDHCHISTGAIINGDCQVQSKSFIGSNTVLKQGRVIPEGSVISFGDKL